MAGSIKIEIQKEVGTDDVRIYASLPAYIGLAEAELFAIAFSEVIEVAARWPNYATESVE